MFLKNDKSRFLQHSEPSWEKEKRDRPFNNNRTFIFCYTKCHVTEFSTSSDSRECIFDSLFPSDFKLSERIYFVLVSAKSKEGDQKTDPFRFIQKYDLLEEKYSNILSQVGEMFRNQSHNFVKAETSSSVTQSKSIEQKSCSESGTENTSYIKVLEDFVFSGVAKFL